MKSRPALFLDRDGVINIDHGYVYRREDFQFVDGIFELCIAAQTAGYRIVVVTNQAGIGRGYYSEKDFETLTEWMNSEFRRRGIVIDDVFYCPFHPEHGVGRYKIDSEFRKPNPGMILSAATKHAIDLHMSVLVGDKVSDIQAATAAGVGSSFLYLSDPDDQTREVSETAKVVFSLAEVAALFPCLD